MAKIRNEAATDRDGAVREAIEYAEKHAGQNDADFVRALNLRLRDPGLLRSRREQAGQNRARQKARTASAIPSRQAQRPDGACA